MIPTNLISPGDLFLFGLILTFSFIGSMGKDYLNLFSEGRSMSLIRIILSTVTSGILIFSISGKIISALTIKGIIACSFFCGLIGFELLQKVSSIEGAIYILEKALSLLNFAKGDNEHRGEKRYYESRKSRVYTEIEPEESKKKGSEK